MQRMPPWGYWQSARGPPPTWSWASSSADDGASDMASDTEGCGPLRGPFLRLYTTFFLTGASASPSLPVYKRTLAVTDKLHSCSTG